jgi:CBS domain containing-hemolysin-like protein
MPEGNYPVRLLLIGFILALNAFFAMAEVSLVGARRARLQQMAEAGHLGAVAALSLVRAPEKLLSVIQVGVTLASLLLGWAGEETFSAMLVSVFGAVPDQWEPLLHLVAFVVGFVVMSYLHVLIGEVVPKNIALAGSERLAVLVAPILLVVSRVFSPLVWVIEASAATVSRVMGIRASAHAGGHTPEELSFLVESLRDGGHLNEFEGTAIERLMRLKDYNAREIMTPRNRVVSVPLTTELDALIHTMIGNQYSRLPVYDEVPEKIVGIVHYKDLLRIWEDRRQSMSRGFSARPFRLQNLLRKVLVVPETKPLSQLLEEFRKSPQHIAAVVDEFGTVAGIVTLEDVLEQVFGEIEDEHDDRVTLPDAEMAVMELDGAVPIVDLDNQYDLDIPTGAGFETLAGFLLYKLGRLPATGEVVEHEDLRFTIAAMENHRIARVRMERLEPQDEPSA